MHKAAIETITALTENIQEGILEYKSEIVTLLKDFKSSKDKYVRNVTMHALKVLREIKSPIEENRFLAVGPPQIVTVNKGGRISR